MIEQTPQITTHTPSGSPDVQTISSDDHVRMAPFIAVIIILILSNIFFALAYIQDDDGDDDPDPGGGNGAVTPGTPIRGNITVLQSYELIQNNTNNSGFVILDVRTPTDYRASRIPGAINLDYFNDSFEFYLGIFDKNLTYLVYCDGGGISSLALDHMETIGYMKIYHMLNGFERWKELGYEVEGEDS